MSLRLVNHLCLSVVEGEPEEAFSIKTSKHILVGKVASLSSLVTYFLAILKNTQIKEKKRLEKWI